MMGMIRIIRNRYERIPRAYRPTPAYTAVVAALCTACGGFVGWLFFEHGIAAALAAAAASLAILPRLEAAAERKKRLTASQFEQLLFSLGSSLQAGKSVENALREAEWDLDRLYGGGRSALTTALRKLNRMTENGIPVERGIEEFRRELALEEIDEWADMFVTCRRTGGDLVRIMRQTSRAVVEKINMERELGVLIAGKRFESKALSVVPFAVVGMFRYGSPDYMDALYAGQGRIVMAAALAMLAFGIWLAGRMTRIEV